MDNFSHHLRIGLAAAAGAVVACAATFACGEDLPSDAHPPPDSADLELTVGAPDSVPLGGTVVVTLLVRNRGPRTARQVLVTDTLTGGTVETIEGGGMSSGSVITWPEIAELRPADARSFRVTLLAAAAGEIRSAAAVRAATPDPDDANNGGGPPAAAVTAVPRPVGWHLLPRSPRDTNGHFQDAAFISPLEGWVVNIPGTVYHTGDGGLTWDLRFVSPVGVAGTVFRSVAFANAADGWVGDLNGFQTPDPARALWETTDGGRSWTNITTRVSGPTPVGVCGMRRLPGGTLVGVGRWSGPAVFVRSDDDGASWTSVDLAPLLTGAVDVHFFDPMRGIAVGGRGVGNTLEAQDTSRTVVIGTEDGGVTWEERFVGSARGSWAWKISFPTPAIGYVATQGPRPGGIVLKTTDSGRTWTEIDLPTTSSFSGIGFVTPLRGWVGGGALLETSDGGVTWQPAGWAEAGDVNKFVVLSDTLAYALGRRIYRYFGEP